MYLAEKKGRVAVVAIVFVVIIVVFISVVSNKLSQEVKELEKKEPITPAEQAQPSQRTAKRPTGVVTRKTIVVRGNDFLEHWFYQGGEVIAKQRVNNDGVIETEGVIPDGKVKFVDTYKNTFGEEYYEDGVRHGPSTGYYESGEVRTKALYEDGELVAKTEYYEDGRIRFEVDYSDAREFGDNKEVGIGKLYFPNGKLKYEWRFTRRDPTGFRKSYNQDGTLREAVFYDENNQVIERE